MREKEVRISARMTSQKGTSRYSNGEVIRARELSQGRKLERHGKSSGKGELNTHERNRYRSGW